MHTNEEEQKRERERSDITYDAVVLTFLFFLFFLFFFDEGRLLELSSSGFLFLLLKNTNVVTKLLKPLN